MVFNDKKDLRIRDIRKGFLDRWGKLGRRDSILFKEINRNDFYFIRCRVFIGNF